MAENNQQRPQCGFEAANQDKPQIRTLPYGPLESCAHLIRIGKHCVMIDPSVDPSHVPADWPEPSLLIATHGHIDHIDQADRLRDQFHAKLAIHQLEKNCLTEARENLSSYMGHDKIFSPAEVLLEDGQRLNLEQGYFLEVMHTPGHSSGSICLLLQGPDDLVAVFTGDTLFAGAVGRTDLPGGDARAQSQSLRKLMTRFSKPDLRKLPLYPGHGPATIWSREMDHNPYLKMH